MQLPKSLLTGSFLCIALTVSQVQSQTPGFQTTLGTSNYDMGHDAIAGDDGNIIVTGAVSPQAGVPADAYTARVSQSGKLDWEHSFGSQYEDGGNEIVPAGGGNYFIAGHVDITGFDACDAFCFMIDQNGDTLWTRKWGFDADDAAYACTVAHDGNFIAVGRTEMDGNANGFILKYDAEGNLLWSKTYGGAEEDAFETIRTISDGYLISGKTTHQNDADFWLLKMDEEGNIVRENYYNQPMKDNCYGMQADEDGNCLMVGKAEDQLNGNTSVLMMRADANGDLQWVSYFNYGTSDMAMSVDRSNDGNWVVCGSVFNVMNNSEDAALLYVDDNGIVNWIKYYGGDGSDVARRIHRDPQGGYIIIGSENQTATNADILLLRVNDEGTASSVLSEENNTVKVKLFPNPATDQVTLSVSDPVGSGRFYIYDGAGNMVMDLGELRSQIVSFSAAALSSGKYFYSFIGDDDPAVKIAGAFEVVH